MQYGDYKTARSYFEGAITADPHHSAAYHGWGQLERDRGDIARARNLFIEGIRNSRKFHPHLYEAIGNLAKRAGLLDEARYWFRTGTNIGKGSQSQALWMSWGDMEWKQADDVTQVRVTATLYKCTVTTLYECTLIRYAVRAVAACALPLACIPRQVCVRLAGTLWDVVNRLHVAVD